MKTPLSCIKCAHTEFKHIGNDFTGAAYVDEDDPADDDYPIQEDWWKCKKCGEEAYTCITLKQQRDAINWAIAQSISDAEHKAEHKYKDKDNRRKNGRRNTSRI